MRVTAKPRWRRQAQTYFLNIDVVNNQSTTSSKTVKRLIDANELDLLAAELAQGPLATVLKHESSFGLRKPSPSQSDVNKRHRSLSKRHDHNRFERRSDKRRRSRSPSRPSTSHRRYVHSPIRPQSTHQKAHFARHDSESSSQFRNSSVCRRSLPVSNSNTSSSKLVQPNNFHRPRRSHYSHHNNDSISPSEHQRSVKRQQCQKSSALMKSHNLHTVEYNDSVSPRQKKGRYTNSLHKSALSPHHSTSTFIDDAAAKACAALARPLESAMTFNSNHTHHQSQKFQHHHHHHRHHHHHQQQHQQQQQLPQHKQQQQNHHHHHKNHHYSVTHKRMQDSISSTSSRMSRDSYTHTHTQTTSYTQLCATYPPSSSSSRTTQASLTSTITATPVVNKTYSASGTTCNVSQAVLDSLNLSRPATLTKTPVAAIPRQPSFLFRTIKMNPLMQEPKQPVFSQHNVPLKNITQTPRNHTSKKITRKKKNDAEKDLSYHHRIIENSGEDAISDDFIDDDDDDDDDVGGAMVDEDDEDVVSDDDDDDEDNDDDDGGGGMSSDEATTTLKKKLTTRKYNKRCGAGTLVCKVESTKENTEEIELVDKLIESLKYLQKRNRRSGHIIASRRAIARPTYLSCGLYADLDFPGNHLDKSSILPLPIGEGAEMLNHTVDFTLPLSMLHTHLVGRDLDTLRQHVGRSKAVPPPYIPVRNSVCASSFDRALMKSEPSQACNCPAKLIDGCGAQCVNRVTRFECMISKCRSGRSCTNQVMQRRQSVKLSVRHMGDKGWGLILEEDVRRGQFIIEYIGEIIDLFECERRLREDYDSEGLFYFLNFGNAAVVDATRYGNPARFTNHSCDPTACTQKWNVNGNLRVGIFARRDYAKGTEVTFDYMFERMGQKKQACLCGSTNCCGFLGSKKKSEPPPSDDEHETSSFTIDESEERIRYDSQAQMMQIAELIQHSTLPEWLERLTDQFTGSSSNPLMCARNIRHGFSRFKNRLRRFNIGV